MADEFINTLDTMADEDITDLLITRNITEYKDNIIKTVGTNAFNYCYYLETIDMPNVDTIGVSAFNYCTKLSSINMPKLGSVSASAFVGAKVTSIFFPNATTINTNAFTDCINLTTADLHIINKIYANSFKNSALSTLIIRRDDAVCTLNSTSAFEGTPIANGDGYIYVPKAMVEKYQVATNWLNYANQFRAIEDYPDICE